MNLLGVDLVLFVTGELAHADGEGPGTPFHRRVTGGDEVVVPARVGWCPGDGDAVVGGVLRAFDG